MAEIRTKSNAKAPIRTFDRSSELAGRIKNDTLKTKKSAETSIEPAEGNPIEYASDKVTDSADTAASETVNIADKTGRKSLKTTKNNLSEIRQKYQEMKQQRMAKKGQKPKESDSSESSNIATDIVKRKSTNSPKQDAKVFPVPAESKDTKAIRIKTADTSIGSGQVKTASSPAKKTVVTKTAKPLKQANHSVRTAKGMSQNAKLTVSTAQNSAKAAHKSAQAAKKSAQATKAAAKASKASIKAAAKTAKAAVVAIAKAIKGIISAIIAGGWVVVVIIVVICLIALLLCSDKGIFFSGEDSGNGLSMRTAVSEINSEFNHEIESIKSSNSYDVLQVRGSRASWKEVIAVYAIKTNTNQDDPQEVATVDRNKIEKLRTVFWDMNSIYSLLHTHTHTDVSESTDADGRTVTTTTTTVTKTLKITVSHLTADEIADQYHFSQEQKKALHELLSEEYNDLWSAVLHGIISSNDDIVNVAVSQLGNVGGEPYWSWYGFSSRVEWCACFVSWCANECGYIDKGIIPKYSVVDTGINWFKDKGQWLEGDEEPAAGMIIFFDYADDGRDGGGDHTGIVEKVENGYVYTIEGNSSDACTENMYSIGHIDILGYGAPAY